MASVEGGVGAASPSEGAPAAVGSGPRQVTRRSFSERVAPTRLELLLVGLLGVAGILVGRGLASALPGSSAGIGPLIVGVEEIGAFASQFLVVMGVATCLRLLLATLECRSYLFHPVAIISSAAALPIILSASSRHLPPAWLMTLMGITAALALIAALPALRLPHSRAAGLVLLTVTCGSIVSTTGRIVALYASHQAYAALFGLARAIATLGLLLDAACLVLVGVWVLRRLRFGAVPLLGAACLAGALVWFGTSEETGGAAALVVGRALAAITAHPDPFIGSGVRYFIELTAIAVAGVTMWLEGATGVGAALCFALLARSSGDVPLCALMLMLAALSAVRASLKKTKHEPHAIEPSGRRAPLEVMPATR